MARMRDEAEALTRALVMNLCDVSAAVAWADAQILRDDSTPHPALCDVSLAADRFPQDVAALLRSFPGVPSRSAVSQLLVLLLRDGLKAEEASAPRISSALFQMAYAEMIEDPGLRDVASSAWDALDLADLGYIDETKEQIVGAMIEALESAARDVTEEWSTAVSIRRAEGGGASS